MSPAELKKISQISCKVLVELGKPYHWIQSFVTDDKIYCIHMAENEELLREHARLSNFPIHTISQVKTIIDPSICNQYF